VTLNRLPAANEQKITNRSDEAKELTATMMLLLLMIESSKVVEDSLSGLLAWRSFCDCRVL
jgi:hypothetical protein